MSKQVERPTYVHVGAFTFEIRWMDAVAWQAEQNDDNWGGITDHEQCYIGLRLMRGRREQSYQETLLHEIQHAIWSSIGLNHQHVHFPDDDREEALVTMTSGPMLFVLKNNPHVLSYLADDGTVLREDEE